jgi:very-short-patch-repair endonuclease
MNICNYGCGLEAKYQMKNGKWCCSKNYQSCQELCRKNSDGGKKSYVNGRRIPNLKKPSWNKGLTKESDNRIKKGVETYKKKLDSGKIKRYWEGKTLTEQHKEKISKSMQKAHKEGRAWNIGKSRWNNKPSYPESFMMRVIENEFIDKKYEYEFPFGKYSLDFAWPHKKRCIEIDGEQHIRFEEYKLRDINKDKKLKTEGWLILRILWKDMFNETKKHIEMAKNFIDQG